MDNATAFELEHHGSLDVLQLAYAGYLARCRSKNTLATYESALRRFMHWCVAQQLHPLYDVKRAHVEFYVRSLVESGLKASTVHTMMTPVKGFYDFAQWEEYIDRDPARRVALPQQSHQKVPVVPQRDLTIFVETAKACSPRHWALVAMLYQMGMRISEAAGLQVENYTGWDEGAPMITYIQKGGQEATTPVPISVIRPLELVRGTREAGPMIPRRDGGQLSRAGAAGLVETINRRAMKAGMKRHINPHLLRKMAVTAALDANMSIRDVQSFARHADPRTTSRHYDLGQLNSYRHPVHQIAARLAF